MVEVLFWAAVFVMFVIAELATVQLISVWFALGALVTMIFTAIFEGTTLLSQLGVFILVSGVFLLVTFPWLRKRRTKGHVSTNQELYVGMAATVIEEIDRDKGTGRVRLSGVDWNAVPHEEGEIIPVDSIVIVEKVMGARLSVSVKSECKTNV